MRIDLYSRRNTTPNSSSTTSADTPYEDLQYLHFPLRKIYENTGTRSDGRSASPQERHLLRPLMIGATWYLEATTSTKLPIADPRMKAKIDNTINKITRRRLGNYCCEVTSKTQALIVTQVLEESSEYIDGLVREYVVVAVLKSRPLGVSSAYAPIETRFD